MTVRTTKKTVTFVNPFVLGDFDEILPPGTYNVETDEAFLEGLSFHAYRRVATLFHLPAISTHQGFSRRILTIDPNELDAALKRDEGSGTASLQRSPVPGSSRGSCPEDAATDREAVDRADDEGMLVHPC